MVLHTMVGCYKLDAFVNKLHRCLEDAHIRFYIILYGNKCYVHLHAFENRYKY
jgi:hypothetical protein